MRVCKLDKYAVKDKKYSIAAVTITIRRFGPSGSLKKKNIVLENRIDVIHKIINEAFFDGKYILVIILYQSLKIIYCGLRRALLFFQALFYRYRKVY